jgi:hypothetical protein
MKIKPVVKAVKPKYPDKSEIDLNKALLYYRPKLWLKKPLIGLTLSALITAGLTGCGPKPGNDFGVLGGAPPPPDMYAISDEDTLDTFEDILPDTLKVPFFEHGEGIGWWGGFGDSGSIATYEEDAYEIISEELAKAGFAYEKYGDYIKDATVPATDPYSWCDVHATFNKKTIITHDLIFDGYIMSDDKKINIEYVSGDDCMSWIDPDIPGSSTVTTYETKETARELKKLYEDAAVFYDPLDGEENLRLQVLDFIEWLKSINAVQ